MAVNLRAQKFRGLRGCDRGVSEIVGVLIASAAVFGFSMMFMLMATSRAEVETWGIVDAVRAAEHRQAQLLSLVYYGGNANTLRVYVFNYGSEDAEIDRVWLHPVGSPGVERAYELHDAISGASLGGTIPPKVLACFTFPDTPPDNYYFTFVTRWRAAYYYLLTVKAE